jgi:ribonucleoside-diphosphate reductase alpha chain
MSATDVATVRVSLPRERESITHKFEIAGHEGYVTVGLYEDGSPGEIFLAGFGKDGSFIQCMMGCWAKSMSNSLQYGQPLHKLVTNYLDMRFEPYGRTTNPDVPEAKSIPDYLARWLALRFLTEDERESYGIRVEV